MPSDPIREALVNLATTFIGVRNRFDEVREREDFRYRNGKVDGVMEALKAYDQAKFALGDTADAETIEVKRSRTRRKK